MDTRRPILVNGEKYRRYGLAQKPEPKGDTLADVVAALSMMAFLIAFGFWMMGVFG